MNKHIVSSECVRGLRRRITVLLTASTLIVACAFGLSFYFALVSSQTAIVNKVPELESVILTLKRLLIFNTFAVAAVLIGSLALLSVLITARMFRPLESMMQDLRTLGDGTLPRERDPVQEEPFAGFDAMFGTVLSVLHSREEKEIGEIQRCLAILNDRNSDDEVKVVLEKMLHEKGAFIGTADASAASSDSVETDLFLQPF